MEFITLSLSASETKCLKSVCKMIEFQLVVKHFFRALSKYFYLYYYCNIIIIIIIIVIMSDDRICTV